ncbi:uncharacterized protein LOC123868953 isoform X2 [Maniola jurtina]|uniref:uncharacterized protein LOC123868953 isoform X2 n=1 Tax=Maniola jurtina TaxID=191418 RepID=UPI001E689AF3|nr:uncharacterized protein LOC123868953 isoform X2 [Maniola jurtina]
MGGFTFLKQRSQGNKLRWWCQYANKGYLPEWIPIYFVKNNTKEYRCNICEDVIRTDIHPAESLQHIKKKHKEIYELHKNWKKVEHDESVGFQIEFLQLNEKDNLKPQPVMVEQICEVTGEMVKVEQKPEEDDHFLLVPSKKKNKISCEFGRKRSWVWKYFDKLTNIIYRCNLCNAVLSIKGCNTNNMNRHVRTRHPVIYKTEVENKHDDTTTKSDIDFVDFVDLGQKKDDSFCKTKDDTLHMMRQRRSWIWSYFNRISGTLAQCKLCNRNICHGGNATGNMNRHLKMVHNKTAVPDNHNWIWKVFENEAEELACKICHFKCIKFDNVDNSIKCILHHLKTEHGVVSSDQIITETEYEVENVT